MQGGKKKLQLLERICDFRRVVIDPDGGCSRQDHSSEYEDVLRWRECVLQRWRGGKTAE